MRFKLKASGDAALVPCQIQFTAKFKHVSRGLDMTK